MGSPTDFQSMIDFVQRHQIIPVMDSVFSMKSANDALGRMSAGTQFGKIVLSIPD